MKKLNFTLFTVLFLAVCIMGTANANSLIITGVVDGSLYGGTPKAVELYALADITHLSDYGLGSANNGGGTDGEEFTFPEASADAGDFIYISYEASYFSDFFGFAPDYVDNAVKINGDDAIELFQNGVVIDVFGDIDTDGTGEPWDYEDGWAYRQNGCEASFNFAIADWTFSEPDALYGISSNDTAALPMPVGTYSPSPVPLPSPLFLFCAGIAALLGSRKI